MLLINNRDSIEWKPGMTVNDVLAAMGYEYSLITVTVDNILIPHEEYNSFFIPDNASVTVFHLAHGG